VDGIGVMVTRSRGRCQWCDGGGGEASTSTRLRHKTGDGVVFASCLCGGAGMMVVGVVVVTRLCSCH
jgi:hypothetical protein